MSTLTGQAIVDALRSATATLVARATAAHGVTLTDIQAVADAAQVGEYCVLGRVDARRAPVCGFAVTDQSIGEPMYLLPEAQMQRALDIASELRAAHPTVRVYDVQVTEHVQVSVDQAHRPELAKAYPDYKFVGVIPDKLPRMATRVNMERITELLIRYSLDDVREEMEDPSSHFQRGTTPTWYVCEVCGAAGVALYRKAASSHVEMHCAQCVREVSRKTKDPATYHKNFVPAVPARGHADSRKDAAFYGLTSIPNLGCLWWESLPNEGVAP